MQNNITEWYLELDIVGNEILYTHLSALGLGSTSPSVISDDQAIEHVCIPIEYAMIAIIKKAAKEFKFNYKVFVIEPGRPARQFFLHTKVNKSAIAKKALADLEKIQAK